MFEETLVCMHCGRPVDNQVYCSDECESLDATSPSASASSSVSPSPYLQSTMDTPGNFADIPPLVPSILGGPAAFRGHRPQHSVSSSSNSSVGWSALSDEDADDMPYPRVTIEGEQAYSSDVYGDSSLKLTLHPHSTLLYARRPSSVNHRSTIPLLHRRASSTSSPLVAPARTPLSAAFSSLSVEDDISDVPSISLSSSVSSTRSRKNTVRPIKAEHAVHLDSGEQETTVSAKRRMRNRTSLPAYFSLLQFSPSSPPSIASSGSSLSSRQALASLSQSLRTSPTTPRIAQPLINLTHAHAETSSRVTTCVEPTPRGRHQQRDQADARSPSGRRSMGRSPPRRPSRAQASSPSPCHHQHVTLGSQARARLDSVEKVFEWVSKSPVASGVGRGRTVTRRNSSPLAKPVKYEMMRGSGVKLSAAGDLYARSIQHVVVDEEEGEMRGRRRANELNESPLNGVAPGYGNGRSGLKARERGRLAAFR